MDKDSDREELEEKLEQSRRLAADQPDPVIQGWLFALVRDLERRLQDRLSCTRFRRHRVRCFMEQEVRHGEKAVYAGVQA